MSEIQFTNQYPAELASDLTAIASSLSLKSGHGDNFPAIAQGQDKYFMVTVVDKNGNREIVKIIQRASGSDTLVVGSSIADQPSGNVSGRAQEGTTALAVTYTDDHLIELRLTAGIMQGITNQITVINGQLSGLGTISTQSAAAVNITGGSAEIDNEATAKKIKARDHGDAATPEIVNMVYGTGSPPTANTVPIGTVFLKYVA